jgi:chemotaxis family two-component system response regulator Rcp1
MAGAQVLDILLVEDNEDHALLTADALHGVRIDGTTTRVHVVSDGDGAVAFLRRQGCYVDAPRPDLILLDIRMPNRDGFDVLREIKADQSLQIIPTIILTTSDAEVDIVTSYRLGANEYVIKPVSADQYLTKVQAIPQYWIKVSAMPPKG